MYKILIHGMNNSIGGTESVIMNYYRKLNGSEIHFDFLCNKKLSYEKEIISSGSKIYYLTSKSKHPFLYRRKIENFFKNNAHLYDCIWANESGLANIDYLKLAKRYGIKKRVIESHTTSVLYSGVTKPIKNFLHNKHKKIIEKYATDFWAVSKEASMWLYPKKVWSNTQIIKNAININHFSFNLQKRYDIRKKYNLTDNYVIGLVGRLSPQKNQLFVLDILKNINIPNAKVVIVGDGPDRDKILMKAKELNINNKILLPGAQKDMQAWYSAFDCYILPSLFEGLSVSGLEAQANGLPILVSVGSRPHDLKVNNNFSYLSLNKSVDVWCNQIKNIKKNQKRLSQANIISNFNKSGLNLDNEYVKVKKLLVK